MVVFYRQFARDSELRLTSCRSHSRLLHQTSSVHTSHILQELAKNIQPSLAQHKVDDCLSEEICKSTADDPIDGADPVVKLLGGQPTLVSWSHTAVGRIIFASCETSTTHYTRKIPLSRSHKIPLQSRRPSVAYAHHVPVIRPDLVKLLVETGREHPDLGENGSEDSSGDG